MDIDGDGHFREVSWQEALHICEDLEFAGESDWRLPNINELLSIVDYSESAPSLPADAPFLPTGLGGPICWTSTSDNGEPVRAWAVHMDAGLTRLRDKVSAALNEYAWAVRDAPPPPTQCSDGVDNDGDGRIDLDDRQCKSSDQDSETHPKF